MSWCESVVGGRRWDGTNVTKPDNFCDLMIPTAEPLETHLNPTNTTNNPLVLLFPLCESVATVDTGGLCL